jgi:hypothetical protein
VIGSASNASAVARADPIRRGSVQDTPLSSVRPTLAKASRNPALCDASRKSQANVSPAPAPAAIPFTAAMTGLGIVGQGLDDRVVVLFDGAQRPRIVRVEQRDMFAQILADAEPPAQLR